MSTEGAALLLCVGPSGLIGPPLPPRADARGYLLPALRASIFKNYAVLGGMLVFPENLECYS
jgi:hypothetical protein